jgi:hypothetical protein
MISCNSNKCDLEGCEAEGEGWENYEDNPECASYTACRIKSSGGYCSKNHAIEGLSN